MDDPRAGRTQDERWIAVDEVLGPLIGADRALDDAVAMSDAAGLPPIQVAPAQGKLLHLIARSIGARNILEVGTLGGYSTIWLARALPADGRLITLEIDPAHARVASENIAAAGLAETVEVLVGPAVESLGRLKEQMPGRFDLVFIDADKLNTSTYFEDAVALCHPGSLIIVDNVVRDGGLADPASDDVNVVAMQRFVNTLAADDRVDSTVIQTVGVKGYDGFALALVR